MHTENSSVEHLPSKENDMTFGLGNHWPFFFFGGGAVKDPSKVFVFFL